MEEKIIVIVGVLIRMGVRHWLGDKGENIIDIENIAESGTKKFWKSKKFNNTIEGFVMDIAEEFLDQENIEFDSVERQNEILKQIEKDVSIVNIDSKKLIKDFTESETLCKTILDVNAEEREEWSEREKGYYQNCVKYISELCIKFMSKWPDFTTSGIEVIIERQYKYAKEIHSIAEELKKLNSVVMGTETTYRELEKKYRDEIIYKYGKVDLIGSGIKDRKIRKYDISSAYVELNCYEDEYKEEIELSDVFKDINVVWISGEAGSGKTTFLKWVAICSAKNDYDKVDNIRNTIPIVIELRNITQWPLNIHEILEKIAKNLGQKYENEWGNKIFEDNRAILLIDGLDEIPEEKREKTYEFIEELLYKYKEIKVMVTARNSVNNCLQCKCKVYEIQPMKMCNIKEFILYWHQAVLHDDAIIKDIEIKKLQNSLFKKIASSPALKVLARNPLLCAMICALNYVNNQNLPENKMELYESCCKMLIEDRDAERKIKCSNEEFQKIEYSQKRRILEDMAYWMIRNNNSSVKKCEAIEYLKQLLQNTNIMPKEQLKKDPSTLLDFLVERSGIIREPQTDTIDFVHKTFMEYLAVKSICRNCDWDILVDKACNTNWKETIVMCFSEMGNRQVSQVLEKMIETGKIRGDDRYMLIASLGASNAMSVSPEIKNEIDLQIKKLIPPKMELISQIAQAGNYLLSFLYDSDQFSNEEKRRCLSLLNYLGTEDILPNVMSYISLKQDENIVNFALKIISQYSNNILKDYGITEQLAEFLMDSICNDELYTYEILLNLLNDFNVEDNELNRLQNIKKLHVLCNETELYNSYKLCNFYKYMKNIEEVEAYGDITNIKFLNYYTSLKVLSIKTRGDAFDIVVQLGRLQEKKQLKKFTLHADVLSYFCSKDLQFGPFLEKLEIYCEDPLLEINLEGLKKFTRLREIIVHLDSYVEYDIQENISTWQRDIPHLRIECVKA